MDQLTSAAWAALPWLIAGLGLVVVHAAVLLPRQPEPAPDVPDADTKPSYAQLATWRLIVACLVICLACQPLLMTAPGAQRPAWLVWSSGFAVLATVDAVSTWIPRGLTRLCLIELAVGLGLGALVWGDASALLGAALGACALGAMFWALWRFGAGIGFADVRMAVGVGALTGSVSWDFLIMAVFAATIIGALWGVIHRLVAGPGRVFAYAPALWAGPWVAQLAQRLA
ncbi:hypothetical protein FAM22020_000934 [Propionibacterium freudenreichii]|uniref:prepilin peptidase n=1 Tax=Propionibacterium freudenreichii TaxID=1744 RepID=UPI0005A5C6C8|nr:prepilin peptidase [Propionibacterium freudenreichii]MDK9293955.1 prepilin peptidase [Propionibacterium freudenreichii]MDK9353280.1 hypothetical protein [Propionibacterium freudenreichii]MDK9359344.1 prepilin peptidase [Propionibacterium freudenreichii]MDK9639373.1 prepilin peptidase [Propionibacterium freudenreichii]MDK9658795.1 prepilin peptidase [Propionibacterium freudenreichii]